MRSILLVAAITLSGLIADAAPPPAPAPAEAPAADAFPLPRDAAPPKAAKGGGGRIQTYEVPRGRDAVVAEVKAALGKGGWKIAKEDLSPSKAAVRLQVEKNAKLWRVSFVGDATRTQIILTVPG